jgi:SagB-type dehydrogenase family enzyme
MNTDTTAAWEYHNATKHTPRSVSEASSLDFDNLPLPYKIYSSLEPVPLPTDFELTAMPALEAISRTECVLGSETRQPPEERIPNLQDIARLCFFSNGVTKRITRGSRVIDFRAAACTGALFHVELYLVCQECPGLSTGLYHYGAHDHALRKLRDGDFRGAVIKATGNDTNAATAPLLILTTSTFWRNAWKYHARAYRHVFWDSGTVLANLLCEASTLNLARCLILGFEDRAVNQLLDVNPNKEATVSIITCGHTSKPAPHSPDVAPLGYSTAPLSRYEVDYPEIPRMHESSSLTSANFEASSDDDCARSWIRPPVDGPDRLQQNQRLSKDQPVEIPSLPTEDLPSDPLEIVIRRRGSTRMFTRKAITLPELGSMLEHAVRCISSDTAEILAYDLYLIANAVEGLESGAYALEPPSNFGWTSEQTGAHGQGKLYQIREGNLREEAGFLALGQSLAADAAVNVYFLVDLQRVLDNYGNRGYRLAQLQASITAGKLYLAAYALGLGATGLTFFDDEVRAFFDVPNKSVLFLIAIGRPMKRR